MPARMKLCTSWRWNRWNAISRGPEVISVAAVITGAWIPLSVAERIDRPTVRIRVSTKEVTISGQVKLVQWLLTDTSPKARIVGFASGTWTRQIRPSTLQPSTRVASPRSAGPSCRHRLEGLAPQEDRETGGETGQPDGQDRVQHPKLRNEGNVAYQQDVRHRHQLHQHQHEQHILARKLLPRKGESRVDAEQKLRSQDHRDQQHGVDQIPAERRRRA